MGNISSRPTEPHWRALADVRRGRKPAHVASRRHTSAQRFTIRRAMYSSFVCVCVGQTVPQTLA